MSGIPITGNAMPETVLGFDFGLKRIGVAFGQRLLGTAGAVAVVNHGASGPDWPAIQKLVATWRPAALLVGMPLALDGSEQAMSGHARGFARALGREIALPVLTHDERLTSIAAADRFRTARGAGTRRRRDAALLDAIAAEILIESFFASMPARHETDDAAV